MIRLSIFLLSATLLINPAFAQKAAENLWLKASEQVSAEQNSAAIKSLTTITQKHWSSSQAEKASALLVELHLQQNEVDESKKMAQRFLDAFPRSQYRDRVEVAYAITKVLEGYFYDGIEDLLRVKTWTKNPVIAEKAQRKALKILSASVINKGELNSLLDLSYGSEAITSWIYMQLGRSNHSQGRLKSARYFYAQVLNNFPGTPLAETARQGVEMLNNQPDGPASLLVLAPLSGDLAELGAAMNQGVSLAFDEYKKRFGKDLQLLVIDDQGDPVTSVRKAKIALQQESVIGVIGPMMSGSATAVAAWMSRAYPEIPMITPTATDNGIAQLGSNIFQLNPPPSILSAAVAEYAINCLGHREFAILSPYSQYGEVMSNEFAESMGASVVAYQQYEEGNADFNTEFKLLRTRKFEIDNRRRNMQRGIAKVNSIIPKERAQWMADSVISFDGVFIAAADAADAATMASNAAFNKIGGQLLGTSGWYGRSLLAQGKRYVENSYFSVPFSETADNSSFEAFAKKFEKKWRSKPKGDKVSGLSYDATKIILDAYSKKPTVSIPQVILNQKEYPGAYGAIVFDKNGTNKSTEIVTVNKNRFNLAPTTCKQEP